MAVKKKNRGIYITFNPHGEGGGNEKNLFEEKNIVRETRKKGEKM